VRPRLINGLITGFFVPPQTLMMRLKKAVALIGLALVVLIMFVIYSAKDLSEFPGKKQPVIDYERVGVVIIFQNCYLQKSFS
jgi:F0F1-type ATP synthase membrane subunit a